MGAGKAFQGGDEGLSAEFAAAGGLDGAEQLVDQGGAGERQVKLLGGLDAAHPIRIEAFVSPEVPETYVQTRLDMLNRLREMKAKAGSKVLLRIIPTKPLSEEAARAEQRYGIQARRVFSMKRGRFTEDNIFLGVAITSGLEKVILPFIDRGIPVE